MEQIIAGVCVCVHLCLSSLLLRSHFKSNLMKCCSAVLGRKTKIEVLGANKWSKSDIAVPNPLPHFHQNPNAISMGRYKHCSIDAR